MDISGLTRGISPLFSLSVLQQAFQLFLFRFMAGFSAQCRCHGISSRAATGVASLKKG